MLGSTELMSPELRPYHLASVAVCSSTESVGIQRPMPVSSGPLMATKMACPGAGMAQESAFFALMRGPVSLTFAADGTLILTGAEGRTAVLKRAI